MAEIRIVRSCVMQRHWSATLGTLFLIIFQARRGLKHPHASLRINTTSDSSLDVKNIHKK